MNVENWQVRFTERPERLGREMFIFRRIGEQMEVFVFPQEIETKMVKPGDVIPTGFYLSGDLFQSLVDSIHKDFKPSELQISSRAKRAWRRFMAGQKNI